MESLFSTGRIIDAIIILTLVEMLLLCVYYWRTGKGIPTSLVVSNLMAGLCLLLAVRLALSGVAWSWIASCLLASLLAHLANLRALWRRVG